MILQTTGCAAVLVLTGTLGIFSARIHGRKHLKMRQAGIALAVISITALIALICRDVIR